MAEVDAMLHSVWIPIFRMYAEKLEPSWDCFAARFVKHVPPRRAMSLRPLIGEGLRRTLKRMRSSSVPGPDGWRVAGLKLLPDSILDRLAELFCVVEETGEWPVDLAHGIVSLIPKGEGSSPDSLRPIIVMPVVCRLWASTRLRSVIEWPEGWIHVTQHGFRPGHGPEDVWWRLALRVEQALLDGSDLVGISLGCSKRVGRIPSDIVHTLAEHVRMHPSIVQSLRGMFLQLEKLFCFNNAVGEPFRATNGVM